jgi:uncharacterized SAM-binding protein YcdF (DUF218 family)
MAETLKKDFGVPARWQEAASRNTAENALFSFRMLSPKKIRKIFLVTDVWHMKRAVYLFRKAGFYVIPAPMGFGSIEGEEQGWPRFIPSKKAFFISAIAMQEWFGNLAYSLR